MADRRCLWPQLGLHYPLHANRNDATEIKLVTVADHEEDYRAHSTPLAP